MSKRNMIGRTWNRSVLLLCDLMYYKNGIFICILGFAATFFTFYPGFMPWDSMNQYEQSLSGEYNNWQPPIMAAFWPVLNMIPSGPHMILAFHLTLYWAGFMILSVVYKNQGPRLAMYFPQVAPCPCLLNTVGVIRRDVGIATAFKPISWFCLNVVLLAIMAYERFGEDALICCRWLVSFLYFIGYLVYLIVFDFRFIYLSIMISLVLLGMMTNRASLNFGFAASIMRNTERVHSVWRWHLT